ncbi:hypothetical protein DPMN_055873 [Dreissena polymorpha]|uniref:Uncharacterized protein n=1 Tax=Dreissena polymorpha TaxID=45954 RepID=A0A9D4HT37_DREPO|nr:hypothetical protein DPMN_055873 [Dreissena polymorpha]
MASTQSTNTKSFRPSRPATQSRLFPSNRQKRFLDNTCWNFNKPTHCLRISCPHPHVCGFCRDPTLPSAAHSPPRSKPPRPFLTKKTFQFRSKATQEIIFWSNL